MIPSCSHFCTKHKSGQIQMICPIDEALGEQIQECPSDQGSWIWKGVQFPMGVNSWFTVEVDGGGLGEMFQGSVLLDGLTVLSVDLEIMLMPGKM